MEVTMPRMEIWQKAVLEYYIENPKNKWIIVKAIRQCGKSILAEILLVYASLNTPKSVSVVISPVFSLTRKLFNEIVEWAEPVIKKSNGAEPSITFINGSTILFKSAVQGDNIRGNTVKKGGILLIDEAAFVDSDFFYEICTPLVNVYSGDIFLLSTPKHKMGMFYELYTDGEIGDNEMIKTFDWCEYDTSKYLSPKTLEIYRKKLPKIAFECEYLGKFIEADGAVFSNFKECIGQAKTNNNQRLVLGIDWSTGNGGDDTVIVEAQVLENKILIPKIHSFNDKNANDTIDYILNIVKRKVADGYREIHLIVEKNSIGNVFGDILRNKLAEYEDSFNGINWRDQVAISSQFFSTTNSSKEKIIKQLCVLFENKLIVIPNDPKLINQLSIYEAKISSAGHCIYNAPNISGAHDDYCMATAICCSILYSQIDRDR